MKLKKIGVDVDERTFQPVATYELSIPLEAVRDAEQLLGREEFIQTLGIELYNALNEVHKND